MQSESKTDSSSLVDYNQKLELICRSRLSQLEDSRLLFAEIGIYRNRLEHELKVFAKSGYSSIILIISDYIRWARSNGVVVGPGRGSAAGSLVVYLSQITTVDPIRFGLIFERFLNPERISLPDIDTDFSDRDIVIGYLREKYGSNRIAKVGVPSFYKPRSAIDEFSQIFQIDFGDAKRITKLIGDAKTFDEAFADQPLLSEYELKYPQLFSLARSIQGVVRQNTTHPSAVILTGEPIGSLIPMIRPAGEAAKGGQLATSWDGEELDSLGYVKLDILTVDNLSIINRAIKMIAEMIGDKVDFYNLDLDDEKTLKGFEAGETVGVFQFEEPKSVAILQKLKNIRFLDVAAVNALIRPGLDVSKFIHSRNTGQVEYLIPELEPILSSTYGVILYQEQVMKICVELANFSMAKADKVRKIIAKTANQRSDVGLNEVKEDFRAGYIKNDLNENCFEELWAMILACQNYIFNFSHAVSYGVIAYADMFLKRHYPLQFMCAALRNRSKEIFIKDCKRLGIAVLPPDVNKSEVSYSIEGNSIRMGLESIKFVGTKSEQITSLRPFGDVYDLMNRIKPNTNQIEALVFSGACDCFGNRADIADMLCQGEKYQKTTSASLSLKEKEMFGFYLVYDPLSEFEKELAKCVNPDSAKQPVQSLVGGLVTKVKEHQAKSGMMAFVTLVTLGGEMEILVWPSDWNQQKKSIQEGNVIIGIGKKTDKGSYSIKDSVVLRSGQK